MAGIELPDPVPEPWRSLLVGFASYKGVVLGSSDGTVGNHGSYLRAFASWWLRARPDRDVVTAGRADLSDFLMHEAARGLTAATRRSQVGALRRFFDWLVVAGRMAASPAVGLPTPRVAPPNVDIYSSAEAAAILHHTAGAGGAGGGARGARCGCGGSALPAPLAAHVRDRVGRGGVDIHLVQRLLGHSSIASTLGSSHLAIDDLQDTVAGLFADDQRWPVARPRRCRPRCCAIGGRSLAYLGGTF